MRFQEDGTPIDVPKAVTFNNGETTVPTVVQKLQNGENAYFGHDAERPKGRGARVFRNFKLNLESEDEEVREEAKELTAYFLKQLGESYKHQSDVGLLGESTDKVKTYISYPVKWRPETRDFMVKATIDAGFPNVEGMDEAEACVNAINGQYADELIRNGYLKADVPCTVLLIDMGAGTTDLVLCRYTPSKKVKILTTWPTKGDLRFGGAEVDTLLYQYIRDAFPESGLIIDRLRLNNGDAFKSWKQDTVSPYLLRKESVDYFAALEGMLGEAEFDPIDRGVFEKLAQAYLPQFPRLINEALEAGKLSGADVDLVILTGGHSRWYFAREMLEGKLPRFGHLHLDRIQQDPKRIVSLGDLAQETVALGLIRGDHDKVFWEKEEAKQEKKGPQQTKEKYWPKLDNIRAYDSPETIYQYAMKYFNGEGVTKNYSRAVELFRMAARQGNTYAQYNLGCCYQNGIGVGKDEREAVKWYRKAAGQNDADAQNNLGYCYENGIGVEKDEREAVKWYRKAAGQNEKSAQYNLGRCYQNGIGVGKDEREAVKWYRKAAEQNEKSAQYNLGCCYRNGIGVGKDEKEAVKWYRKSAEQNDADAQKNLGYCYENGIGVEKDEREAVKWYRKSAEQNDAVAQYNLGYCYQNGIGVEKDEREAVKWYRKSAEQNDADAQNNLGFCYENGIGVEKDEREAVKWYRKSAEQNDAVAQYNLGCCYRNGIGVKKDDAEAKKWYQKAAEQGYAKAPQALLKVEGKQTEKHYSLEKTVDKKTESQKRKHESVFPLEYNPKSLQRPVIAAVSSDTIAGVKKGSEEIAVIPCGYYGDKVAYLKSDGVAYIKDADAQENELIARERVIAIASSGSCLFGLKENGTVVCLNRNQTDIPNFYKKTADWRHIKALYGMSCDCGLFGIQGDGTVVYAGKSTDIEAEVANWRDVISISGSINICVGLTSTGRVLAAGGYYRWLRKNIPPDIAEWDNIIAVSADETHVVGLKKDGSVITTEDPKGAGRPCCLVEAWQDTIAISASYNSTVGLRADGTILFTGSKRPELVGTKLF